MSGTYLTWLADELRAAGLKVVEYDGWKTRARSSGGFASGRPVCVMWHHTASNTTPQNDASYMCNGSSSKPIANVLIARDGTVWVLAAGATNTNGKGKSRTFSRGTVPADSMNTWGFGMEIANTGVGEPYPKAQIDAAFVVSNTVNRKMGNKPTDVCTHQDYAPDRKIDPATTSALGGCGWQPRSVNSNGSWNCDDLKSECGQRAAPPPTPTPKPPPKDDDMVTCNGLWQLKGRTEIFATYPGGYKVWMSSPKVLDAKKGLMTLDGVDTTIKVQDDPNMFAAFGPVIGPIPKGLNEFGVPV